MSFYISIFGIEYIETTSTCTHILWMKKNLHDMKVTHVNPILIIFDSTSDINIYKNHVFHSNTKHIPIKYHLIREHISNDVVKLEYIPKKEQVFCIFTKPLAREYFYYLRKRLGVTLSRLLTRYYP